MPLEKILFLAVNPVKAFSTSQISAPQQHIPSIISGFRREVDENCALLDYFPASSIDVSGPLSVTYSRFKNPMI